MSRKVLAESCPSLVLACGIILSTTIAVAAPGPWWTVAVLLLVLSIAAADLLAGRLQGNSRALSPGLLAVSVAILVASGLLAMRDPALVDPFITLVGACAAAMLLLRTRRAARDCGVA